MAISTLATTLFNPHIYPQRNVLKTKLRFIIRKQQQIIPMIDGFPTLTTYDFVLYKLYFLDNLLTNYLLLITSVSPLYFDLNQRKIEQSFLDQCHPGAFTPLMWVER